MFSFHPSSIATGAKLHHDHAMKSEWTTGFFRTEMLIENHTMARISNNHQQHLRTSIKFPTHYLELINNPSTFAVVHHKVATKSHFHLQPFNLKKFRNISCPQPTLLSGSWSASALGCRWDLFLNVAICNYNAIIPIIAILITIIKCCPF